MVTDDDVLEKEDMYILDRIKAFAQSQDAVHLPAAKQLVVMIDRTVSSLIHTLCRVSLFSIETNRRDENHVYQHSATTTSHFPQG
jgi:hypothetical protein